MENQSLLLVLVLCSIAGFANAKASPDLAQAEPEAEDSSRRFTVLECYVCVNCTHVDASTPTKVCPRPLDQTRLPGCVTYTEQYQNMKSKWTIRGCSSERGTCKDIKKEHSQPVYKDVLRLTDCDECLEDKCNSSHRSAVDWTLALLTLAITPLVGKLVTSQ